MTRPWPLLLACLIGCGYEPTEVERRATEAQWRRQEAESERARLAALADTPCVDTVINAAYASQVVSGTTTCPRPDQALTFEKDVDNDAWIVCRCPRAGGAK